MRRGRRAHLGPLHAQPAPPLAVLAPGAARSPPRSAPACRAACDRAREALEARGRGAPVERPARVVAVPPVLHIHKGKACARSLASSDARYCTAPAAGGPGGVGSPAHQRGMSSARSTKLPGCRVAGKQCCREGMLSGWLRPRSSVARMECCQVGTRAGGVAGWPRRAQEGRDAARSPGRPERRGRVLAPEAPGRTGLHVHPVQRAVALEQALDLAQRRIVLEVAAEYLARAQLPSRRPRAAGLPAGRRGGPQSACRALGLVTVVIAPHAGGSPDCLRGRRGWLRRGWASHGGWWSALCRFVLATVFSSLALETAGPKPEMPPDASQLLMEYLLN